MEVVHWIWKGSIVVPRVVFGGDRDERPWGWGEVAPCARGETREMITMIVVSGISKSDR